MKKGQTEMLGLVFIVLILALSLVFYIKFSGQKEDIALTMRSNTRVNNMLNAVMMAGVENEQMKDILIRNCDVNDNTCDQTVDLIKGLIEKMKEDRESYQLEFDGFMVIKDLDKEKIGNCEQGIAATPARFTKNGKTYTIKLKLC